VGDGKGCCVGISGESSFTGVLCCYCGPTVGF
jgi:hypothetical protein